MAAAHHSDLVLANQVLAVNPGVILHEQLSAVFAFAKEDFFPARMHLCVLRHIVDAALVNRPAVVCLVVLFHVVESHVHRIWVLHQVLPLSILLDELLKRKNVFLMSTQISKALLENLNSVYLHLGCDRHAQEL